MEWLLLLSADVYVREYRGNRCSGCERAYMRWLCTGNRYSLAYTSGEFFAKVWKIAREPFFDIYEALRVSGM